MTWQAARIRLRESFALVRSRFAWRLFRRLTVAVAGVGLLAIVAEAVVRARLDAPETRVPSTLYTRPFNWGAGGRPVPGGGEAPVLIGPVPGAPVEYRVPVALADVPSHLVQAVLAVEDQRFFEHYGLDLRRIGGALVANLRAGRVVQGGSTITQQLAKNLFLSAHRTPVRKLREAAMALAIEARYDKRMILEAYLNEIYLGQDRGTAIHGVGAASRFYFGKPVGRINLAESALLAGMIQAPNRYAPLRRERLARQRRNLVLALMLEQERAPRKAVEQAVRARVTSRAKFPGVVDARHFRDAVLAGLGRLPPRGVAMYTTLDPVLQASAQRAVREGLARLRLADAEAALVALDPRTGDVLAMVGGRDYGASQFNRAASALRQPGSAFKPVVLLSALEKAGDQGPAFTLASRIEDEPLSVGTGSARWEPVNYDRAFRGSVTVRDAVEQSLNVPFVRIGLAVGPERIVATARRLGIESPLRPVPSLALGSSEVTLLELARSYGVFASGGRLAATRMVLGRRGPDGALPDGGPPDVRQVVNPAEAYLVTSALEGVIARGTGRALLVAGRYGGLAGKTGTSSDWRDAWFVAYSPSLVVGAWVGFDDGRSLGLSGAGAALPIVARFLERADPADRAEPFEVPEGIEVARVGSGDGWSWDCGRQEVFLEGTAPATRCGFEPFEWDRRIGAWQDRVHDWDDRLESRAGRVIARLVEGWLDRANRERQRGARDRR